VCALGLQREVADGWQEKRKGIDIASLDMVPLALHAVRHLKPWRPSAMFMLGRS
jgi:hypothetical protein